MEMIRGDIEQAKAVVEDNKQYEESEMLKERLEWFQDQKLGLIFHWGIYSVAGIVESWQLSEGDEWAREEGWGGDIKKLQTDYWNLYKKFNPVKFNPDEWADIAEKSGIKYLVFTTKHHDGFNMFDTKQSDYKITSPECPFHDNPKANVTKEIFDAFRNHNIGVGVYYSKADWHCPYYWVPGEKAATRHTSYDIKEQPDLWKKFVDFTHAQFKELMSEYGHIDMLWLDAGWVCAPVEDIDMDEIASMARSYQPELIICDRTVGGRHENYITPERCVPDEPLSKPWESGIPLANNWGYVPNDCYKSTREVLHTFIDIVSKGGNFLLGVGPKPDGTLPEKSVKTLLHIGEWLKTNGEGIYGTRAYAPYREGSYAFTQKNNDVYIFYLLEEGEPNLPDYLEFSSGIINNCSSIKMLGTDTELALTQTNETTRIEIPEALRNTDSYACVFKVCN
jgi:alpha-L-fucosidase